MLPKFRPLTFIALVCASFAPNLPAQAGAGSSGGAKVVVCQAGSGRDATVELLDLYEARKDGRRLRLPADSLEIEYALYLHSFAKATQYAGKLSPIDKLQIQSEIKEKIRFVERPESLPVVSDLGHSRELEKGCSLSQLAVYKDSSDLLWVDQNLWNQLGHQGKAAVLAHEQIYLDFRRLGDTTSQTTRRLVGHLFSESDVDVPPMEFSRLNFPSRFGLDAVQDEIEIPCAGTEVLRYSAGNLNWLKIQGNCRFQNLIAYNRNVGAYFVGEPVAMLYESCLPRSFKSSAVQLLPHSGGNRAIYRSKAFFNYDFGYGTCNRATGNPQRIVIKFPDGSWDDNDGPGYVFDAQERLDLSGLDETERRAKIIDLLKGSMK